MDNPKLKPLLLRSLIRDHLPKDDDKKLGDLSVVVYSIKQYGLLSTESGDSSSEKLQQEWKEAIEQWIERVTTLCSSNTADRHFAGINLLGITCKECSLNFFLESYSSWFERLHSLLKSTPRSPIKIASCAALSDLLGRLSSVSSCKKDGASFGSRLIPSVLPLLSKNNLNNVAEAAANFLCDLLNMYPSSFQRHYDNVEAVLMSRIMSGNMEPVISKSFLQLLAFLPKAKGDAASWSVMFQKVLISINTHLNGVFEGFEDGRKSSDVVNLLIPPGKDAPPPLGCSESSPTFDKVTGRSLIARACSLLQCAITMLSNPFEVQVNLPVRALLALIDRALSLDGNKCYTSMPLLAVPQLEFIFSGLPTLHLLCLDLLHALITVTGRQLLPHAVEIVKLLRGYFKSYTMAPIRVKLYTIAKTLLLIMGAGMASYLADDLTLNAFRDLSADFQGHEKLVAARPSKRKTSLPVSKAKKKQRYESSAENSTRVEDDGETSSSQPTFPVSVQISALQALEGLLKVGGSFNSKLWRPKVDVLLINVAAVACEGGHSNVCHSIPADAEENAKQVNLQLVALQVLLASLLSPSLHRPTYLPQALAIFRKGKQMSGWMVADFCEHALLALEPLIHPRSLPLLRQDILEKSSLDNPTTSRRDLLNYDGEVADVFPDDKLVLSWLENLKQTADSEKKDAKEMTLIESIGVQAEQSTIPSQPSTSGRLGGCDKVESMPPQVVSETEEKNSTSVGYQSGDKMEVDMVVLPKEPVELSTTVQQERTLPVEKAVEDTNGESGEENDVRENNGFSLEESGDINAKQKTSKHSAEVVSFAPKHSDSDSESLPDVTIGDPDSDIDSVDM